MIGDGVCQGQPRVENARPEHSRHSPATISFRCKEPPPSHFLSLSSHRRIDACETLLPPVRKVGIWSRYGACFIQLRHLFGRQVPANRPEVLAELFLVARADDDRRDGRPLQEPIERDLRDRLAGFSGGDIGAGETLPVPIMRNGAARPAAAISPIRKTRAFTCATAGT